MIAIRFSHDTGAARSEMTLTDTERRFIAFPLHGAIALHKRIRLLSLLQHFR
jgi:hypothetical protein